MKNFLILGAGTAGTMLANKLVKKLDSREWKITLVDKDPNHYYQAGYLFVPFGVYRPEVNVQPKSKFLPAGVELLQAHVEVIDPANSTVTLVEDGRVLHYDQLAIASGTDIRPDQVEGMLNGGWQQNIFDFYTHSGTIKLAEVLKNWKGGRLVLNVAEMPIKCPVAPLEFVFMADWYFQKRGIRDKVDITYVTPLEGAFTKQKASEMLDGLMAGKNIHVVGEFNISEVDSTSNTIRSWDGREVPYDMLVAIPTNMGADFIERSGMGDELNYVPVNPHTLRSNQWPNVWALGDAANLPTSKAGAAVHYQMEAAVENMLAVINSREPEGCYDGHANCFVETGFYKGVLIDFNYDIDPLPGTYPLPVLGPFSLLGNTVFNHLGKLFFKWMYWNIVIRGIDIPLPNNLTLSGKHLTAEEKKTYSQILAKGACNV